MGTPADSREFSFLFTLSPGTEIFTICVFMLYANYSGTSPLGHLCSDPLFNRPLSSGGTQFSSENVQIIFVFNLLSKEHLYPRERDSFCGSRDPGLTSIQGTLQPRPIPQ